MDKTKKDEESQSSLLKRRAKAWRGLPSLEEVLRGSFLRREIRCGKPGCRCTKGRRHTLLCVTVSFAGGRTRQVTVPAELVDTVKFWIENYHRYWQAIEEISGINRRLLQLRQIPAGRQPHRRKGRALGSSGRSGGRGRGERKR